MKLFYALIAVVCVATLHMPMAHSDGWTRHFDAGWPHDDAVEVPTNSAIFISGWWLQREDIEGWVDVFQLVDSQNNAVDVELEVFETSVLTWSWFVLKPTSELEPQTEYMVSYLSFDSVPDERSFTFTTGDGSDVVSDSFTGFETEPISRPLCNPEYYLNSPCHDHTLSITSQVQSEPTLAFCFVEVEQNGQSYSWMNAFDRDWRLGSTQCTVFAGTELEDGEGACLTITLVDVYGQATVSQENCISSSEPNASEPTNASTDGPFDSSDEANEHEAPQTGRDSANAQGCSVGLSQRGALWPVGLWFGLLVLMFHRRR